MLESLVADVEHRFYGKYRGKVVDNDDPEKLGRLKLSVPSVLGPEVVTGWAVPCVPYGGGPNRGFFFIPEVGDGVWVEFEAGDLSWPIWVGTYWAKPSDPETPRPNDPDGTEQGDVQAPPTCKIIKTVKGHTLQFEDADGDERIVLYEATHGHVVTLDADGVTITDATGNSIEMREDSFKLISKVAFTLDASGQAITLIGDTIDLNKG